MSRGSSTTIHQLVTYAATYSLTLQKLVALVPVDFGTEYELIGRRSTEPLDLVVGPVELELAKPSMASNEI
jgi:hypothetical protein